MRAIQAILRTLKPPQGHSEGGKALIYVWALEQKTSRRGWDSGGDQDVMVPWVMRERDSIDSNESRKTFHRYYHLYKSQELERDIVEAGGLVLGHGYEKDNWWAIASSQPGRTQYNAYDGHR